MTETVAASSMVDDFSRQFFSKRRGTVSHGEGHKGNLNENAGKQKAPPVVISDQLGRFRTSRFYQAVN